MARPTLMRHRKFIRLVARLESQPLARGVLEMLWDAAYEAGDDRVGGPAELEVLAGWKGERGALAHALIACGFVDQVASDDLRIHDLWHHAPDYVQKRKSRELARQQRVSPAKKRRTVTAARRTTSGQRTKKSSEHSVTPKGAPAPAPALKDQDQDPRAGARRSLPDFTAIADMRGHLRAAAHACLDDVPDATDSDLAEAIKRTAGQLRVADYDGREVTRIIDAVRGERDRRRA